MPYLPT